MASFSNEVWEEIFAHVPCVELHTVCRLVCKQWNEIISRGKFIPYKKLYYKYLSLNDEESTNFLKEETEKQGMINAETCFQQLVRNLLMLNHDKRNCESTLARLKSHNLYSLASRLVEESQSNFIQPQIDQSRLWGVVCKIVLISKETWEILQLINLLAHSTSDFSSKDVMEKMYYIAVYLLYFTRKFEIPDRHHYILYHAIHLVENCGFTPTTVQPAIFPGTSDQGPSRPNRMQLTHEQTRIVNHELKNTDLIKIVAFAGTGKTATLVRFTEERPQMKFLILMFNKSVTEEARLKFPSNVTCKTVHQLAFKSVVNNYRKKKMGSDIYPATIINNNMLRGQLGMKKFQRESLVLQTLRRFMGSDADHVTIAHTPAKKTVRGVNGLVEESISMDHRLHLANDAEQLWKLISDPNYTKVNAMPHDAYVKIWQLSKPSNLHVTERVDCIMIDEAQDMNGAMLDVFLRQTGCPRVIVGDPYQQIYQWRFAVNALDDRVTATHVYYLTHSFRFGPEIAFMANSCLRNFKNLQNRCLVGAKIHDSINSSSPLRFGGDAGQVCILSRTNLALFQKVVEIIGCHRSEVPENPLKIFIVGNADTLGLDDLLELDHLRKGDKSRVRNWFLKTFANFEKFVEYADAVGSNEWGAKLAIVSWAKDKTSAFVKAILDHCIENKDDADVIFSTANKSKGMEFDTVALLDDFEPKLDFSPQLTEEDATEQNLLYVAVTRAKRSLVINPACHYTLLARGERHERVVESEIALDEASPQKCVRCRTNLPGGCESRIASFKTIPLYLMRISGDSMRVQSPGMICTLCAGFDRFAFPRYTSCYENLRFPVVKVDSGHLAFRYLMGPSSAEEKKVAETVYEERRQALARRNDFDQI